MLTIRAQANRSGRIVGWRELKEGRLVNANRFARFLLTTTLTDVITDLCALAESLDRDYRIVTTVPNSPTTAALDLSLLGRGFKFVCARRLVRGMFPLNPFAAEFGSNYDVIVTVNSSSSDVQSKVVELLQSKYTCTMIAEPSDIADAQRETRH